MLNFLGYLVFSGFEYCGIILIMLSIFKINLREYKKEFIIIVSLSTIISYIVTIIDSEFVTLFIVPVIIVCLRYLFKINLSKSIIVTLGSLAAYAGCQWIFLQYAVEQNYLSMSDLSQAFSLKTYILQTISATTAITVSIYLRIFNGGFGFSLRSKKKSYTWFLCTTILSSILSLLCLIAFRSSQEVSLFNITGVLLVVSSIIIFYLSHKRDSIEYS